MIQILMLDQGPKKTEQQNQIKVRQSIQPYLSLALGYKWTGGGGSPM